MKHGKQMNIRRGGAETWVRIREWKRSFPRERDVAVSEGVLLNDYCRDCLFCCGPQPADDEPFPMKLLDRQISGDTPRRFHMLDEHTACLDSRGCLALGKGGCCLERPLRPVACNLFPFVVIDLRLYLYRRCPVSVLLPPAKKKSLARALALWLRNCMAPADLLRISLHVRAQDLKRAYEDMRLPLSGTVRRKPAG